MHRYPAASRRLLSAAACLAVPALVALLPAQAAYGDTAGSTSSTLTQLTTTTKVTKTVGSTATNSLTTSSTTSGLGLGSLSLAPISKAAGTSSTAAAACAGVCVDSEGATVQGASVATVADGNAPSLWVTLCSLTVNGMGLTDQSWVGLDSGGPGVAINGAGNGGGSAPAKTGCGPNSTTATGNLAAALGVTHADVLNNDIAAADICGLGAALSGDPTTVDVVCGPDPGTGSITSKGAVIGLVGPTAGSVDSNLNFALEICGIVAGVSADSANPAEGYISCASAMSVPQWAGAVPGLVLQTGNNAISADVKKSLASVDLSSLTALVQLCGVDANVGGSSGLTVNVPQSAVGLDKGSPTVVTGLTLNGNTIIPDSGPYPSDPYLNCKGDANGNPVLSTNPGTDGGITAAVGSTGANGNGGGTANGGSCGGGGNGTPGGPNSTQVFCGTTGSPFPSTGPCNPTAAPTQAEGCGSVIVVLGQTSGCGGPTPPAACNTGGDNSNGGVQGTTGCIGAGATMGIDGVSCPVTPPGKTTCTTNCPGSVLGVSTGPSPKQGVNAAVEGLKLAETGFPMLAGLLGLLLMGVGGLEAWRRRLESSRA